MFSALMKDSSVNSQAEGIEPLTPVEAPLMVVETLAVALQAILVDLLAEQRHGFHGRQFGYRTGRIWRP